MQKKNFVIAVVAGSLLLASQALAHATVKPNTVGIGKFQTFTLSVPSEKPVATVGIRLVLPYYLNYVTPNVKPGWKITTKKELPPTNGEFDMEHPEQRVIEITWTKGNIPAEMRDEFVFSAQVPSQPTTLTWKVYQTYADGTVVSWDQDPNAPKETTSHEESENTGSYSKTEVVDDLTPATAPQNTADPKVMIAVGLSAISLIAALAALKKTSQHKS